jgi:hypothetical protein
MSEYKLCDIVNGTKEIENMPEPVLELIRRVYQTSLEFQENVVDLRISNYPKEDYVKENSYQVYFTWVTDEFLRSNRGLYISYDLEKQDFFDWLKYMCEEDVRYTKEELVNRFKEKMIEGKNEPKV